MDIDYRDLILILPFRVELNCMKRLKSSLYLSVVILLVIIGFNACVTARQYEDMETKSLNYLDSMNYYLQESENLQKDITRLDNNLDEKEKIILQMSIDTTDLAARLRMVKRSNAELDDLYEKVIAQNRALLSSSSSDKEALLAQLNKKERELSVINQDLQEKELAILKKEAEIAQKEYDIEQLTENLEEREKKVSDLEKVIASKDSLLTALKNSITLALVGFSDEELSIEQKEDKLYVSLYNKLLFKSGSTLVDTKGKDAIAQLAKVLKKEGEFDIIVEGHTDNVPLNSGKMKDNWDLSVLRATSVVRILTGNGVDETRIMPSGKGEFHPKASNDTPQGRAANRRTEIILSPKLNELLEIIK